MKNLEDEVVDNDEILKIVNEIKKLFKEDRYNNDSFKDLNKDYPDKNKELEEAPLHYMGEKDLKLLKTGFSVKWKYLTKTLAYPYQYFQKS